MTCSDPIADMLTRIRNALLVKKKKVFIPHSRMKEAIVKILFAQGFILSHEVILESNNQKTISVKLKYVAGESTIKSIRRESKPGSRVYTGKDYRDYRSEENSVRVLSTSAGVMSSEEAFKLGIGGELLCTIS